MRQIKSSTEDVNAAKTETERQRLVINFDDGSTYNAVNDGGRVTARAFLTKAKDQKMTPEEALEHLRKAVDEYWGRRMVLTKFGTSNWEHDYKNKADLCKDCAYAYLRAYILAYAMEEMGQEGPKVLILGDNGGVKEITADGAVPTNILDSPSKRDKKKKKTRQKT